MARMIGIVHRTKKTAADEARPTLVAIQAARGKTIEYKLETENEELDFMSGKFVTKRRDMRPGEDLSLFFPRHIVGRKIKDSDDQATLVIKEPTAAEKKKDKKAEAKVLTVPEAYDGFHTSDTIVMTLGGSGDRLAYAYARQATEINGMVIRLPPAILKSHRGDDREKDQDHQLLIEIAAAEPTLFYRVTPRDMELIRLTEIYRQRVEAMKARIACEQLLRQRYIGQIFLSEEGKYPEGNVEDEFDAIKASDPILQGFVAQEKVANQALAKAVAAMDIWPLFEQIKGVGPSIGARLIVAVSDIRRFPTPAKLKAYMGVHVMQGGRFGNRPEESQFVRRRAGEQANWKEEGRQGLFLLADQFNRQIKDPNSKWGSMLAHYKVRFREKHPEVAMVQSIDKKTGLAKVNKKTGAPILVKRYTDGHLHKRALWRVVTKFTEWLWREWWKIERAAQAANGSKVEERRMDQLSRNPLFNQNDGAGDNNPDSFSSAEEEVA